KSTTPLRQRMIQDMKVRNLAPLTQTCYVERVARFAKHFGRSPELLGPEEIRGYQVYLVSYLQEAFDSGELQFHGTLANLSDAGTFKSLMKNCRKTEWVVYSKPPFGGPAQVLDYLGRYTHRVAISNDRLLKLEDGNVTFRFKDYKAGNAQKTVTVTAEEFI